MKKLIEFLKANNQHLSVISKSKTENKAIKDASESLSEFEKGLKWIEILDKNEDIVIDALNNYINQANTELLKKDLGDIERKNWEGIKERLKQIFKNIE